MRKILIGIMGLVLAVGIAAPLRAQLDLGPVTVSQDDLKVFYKAVGEYFGLVDKDVNLLHDRGISNEEMSTIFTIARAAGVPYTKVLDMRLAGRSYNDIYRSLGLSPEIFYTPMKDVPTGPPYGNAYGYYKNKDKIKWKNVHLSDDDVINLTNLKFVSEHYGYSPEDVVKLRSGGNDFVQIQKKVHTKTKGPKDKSTGPSGDKNKGKDADKGKSSDKGNNGKADKSKGGSKNSGNSGKSGGKSSSGKSGGNSGKGGGKSKPKL